MRCSHCGNELPESAKFCAYCGAKVERQADPVPVKGRSPETGRATASRNGWKVLVMILLCVAVAIVGIAVLRPFAGGHSEATAPPESGAGEQADDQGEAVSGETADGGAESTGEKSDDTALTHDGESAPEQTNRPAEYLVSSGKLGYNAHGDLSEGFHEDRAWVYLADESYEPAVIDETGRIVYQTSVSQVEDTLGISSGIYSPYLYSTPFRNGFSVLYIGGMRENDLGEGFIVIDRDGNELYHTNDGQDTTSYYFLARTDDLILVGKNEATFSENETEIIAMDQYGTVVKEGITVDDAERLHEMGEGIFTDASGKNVLNVNTWNWFALKGNKWSTYFIADFTDGYALVRDTGNSFDPSDGTRSPITPADLASEETMKAYFAGSFFGNARAYNFGEGLYSDSTSSDTYCDLTGAQVIRLDLPEGASVIQKTAFDGGLAGVKLKGADGNTYLTVIDRQGTFQYEPIQIKDTVMDTGDTGNSTYSFVQYKGVIPVYLDGKNGISIVMPDGQILTPGEDDLSVLGKQIELICYKEDRPILSGGFFDGEYLDQGKYSENISSYGSYGSKVYVSLDGTTVLSTADEYNAGEG